MLKKVDDPILDEFLKAFEIDSKGEGKDEESEEYANSTESDESFDSLSSQLIDDTVDAKVKGIDLSKKNENKSLLEVVQEICTSDEHKCKETKIVHKEEAKEEEADIEGEDFSQNSYDKIEIDESISKSEDVTVLLNIDKYKEEAVAEDIPESKDELKVEEEKSEEEETEEDKEDEEETLIDSESYDANQESNDARNLNKAIYIDGDSINDLVKKENNNIVMEYNPSFDWQLESPSPIYNKFYRLKTASICKGLVGGKLDFDKMEKEISSFDIDVTSETFDQREVDARMQQAIAYRERVLQMSVRVNAQYHILKGEYESLQGILAKVEYLKPAKRQDGLEYEHMGDLKTYLSRLEALHNSLAHADKVLDAIYQMLSRKVSMYMELKTREIYDNSVYADKKVEVSNPLPQKKNDQKVSSSENYDVLPSDVSIKNNSNKTGVIDWGEI